MQRWWSLSLAILYSITAVIGALFFYGRGGETWPDPADTAVPTSSPYYPDTRTTRTLMIYKPQ